MTGVEGALEARLHDRLRPRDLGGILDQSFRVYRRHFLTFLAIVAIVHVPVQTVSNAITVFLVPAITTPEDAPFRDHLVDNVLYFGFAFLLGLIYRALMFPTQGAVVAALVSDYMGEEVTFKDTYRQALGRLPSLAGMAGAQLLLLGTALLAPVLLLFIFSVLVGESGPAAPLIAFVWVPVAVLLAIGAFYFYVRLQIAVPAAMLERLGSLRALERSWTLVRGYWWRGAALVLVLGTFDFVVSVGPALVPLTIILIILPETDTTTINLIGAIISIVGSLFFKPVQLLATTLLYLDLRVRKEGYDLEAGIAQTYETAI
jgi:hypothetical protein